MTLFKMMGPIPCPNAALDLATAPGNEKQGIPSHSCMGVNLLNEVGGIHPGYRKLIQDKLRNTFYEVSPFQHLYCMSFTNILPDAEYPS